MSHVTFPAPPTRAVNCKYVYARGRRATTPVLIHGCTHATSVELIKEKIAKQQKGLETKLKRICNVQSKVRGGMALGLPSHLCLLIPELAT